jgi:hypothetical protein
MSKIKQFNSLFHKFPFFFSRFSHNQRLNFYGILAALLFNEFIIYYINRLGWESASCETGEWNEKLNLMGVGPTP